MRDPAFQINTLTLGQWRIHMATLQCNLPLKGHITCKNDNANICDHL